MTAKWKKVTVAHQGGETEFEAREGEWLTVNVLANGELVIRWHRAGKPRWFGSEPENFHAVLFAPGQWSEVQVRKKP